jgi:hypothetical protein
MIFAPDDFDGDWYGYLTNQAGHAYLVGCPAAMALSPWNGLTLAPFVIGLAYGIIWERIVQGGRNWRDSLEDTVHVTSGASVICAAFSGDILTAGACLAAQGGLLMFGIYRRVWQ